MKSIRDNFFAQLGRFSVKYYWQIIVGALFLTIIFSIFAEKLKMDMTWLSMAPQKAESVKQFKKILKEFGSANPIIVAVSGDDPVQLRQVAKELAFEYKQRKDDIKDVNYKMDMNFIKSRGMMLQKAKDLKRFNKILKDFNLTSFYKNLNDDFEKEYIEESNESLAKQEKNAIQSFDSLKEMLISYKAYLSDPQKGISDLNYSINKFSQGEEYFLSRDKKMILVFVQPIVSMTDMDRIIPVVRISENILNKFREKYPGLEFGQTGMSVISRDEWDTGIYDTMFSLVTVFLAVFILLSFSFRMIAAPFFSLIVLLLGIVWDLGIIYFAYGRLNLMTAMIGVILIGLGIDYAIHIITGYTQNRYKGFSQEKAIINTYQKIGPGLLTGALTTAIAFLVFLISEINLMQELGFAIGIGIICTFLVSIIILPAMIITKEKIQKRFKMNWIKKNVSMEYHFLSRMGERFVKYPLVVIVITLLLTGASIIVIPKLHFISDFRKLEAKGLISLKLMDEINEKYDISPDPVHMVLDDIEMVNEKAEKLNKFNSVGFVDSIANYLPSKEKQIKRIPYINKIRSTLQSQGQLHTVNKVRLIDEIKRLEKNIIEISDMSYLSGLDKLVKRCDEMTLYKDNKKTGENIFDQLIVLIKNSDQNRVNQMQKIFAKGLKKNFTSMCSTQKIRLNDVPENIRNLYMSKDKKRYLINVYSAKEIWKNLFTSPFLKDVKKIAPNITGTPIFMYDVITYSAKGGRQATLFALIAIALLLLIDFRNLKFTLISLIPLILGSIWVLGFLVFSNIYFTWMTIMIVPLIIGIGIDDGVHIIHRYRLEGEGSSGVVLRTTGKAVFLTSLTTMIAFGSFYFCKMVGYQQFGIVLFFGIGVLFLLSTVLLPVLLKLFEKKNATESQRH